MLLFQDLCIVIYDFKNTYWCGSGAYVGKIIQLSRRLDINLEMNDTIMQSVRSEQQRLLKINNAIVCGGGGWSSQCTPTLPL